MPRPPTIHNTPPSKSFVCPQCHGNFRSNAGRTRHINAKHNGLRLAMNSPTISEEANHFTDISSCPGFPSPPPGHIFDSPSQNSDTFNYGAASENDFNISDGNTDITPPLSPSRDTAQATTSIDYHPYINGKINNL